LDRLVRAIDAIAEKAMVNLAAPHRRGRTARASTHWDQREAPDSE